MEFSDKLYRSFLDAMNDLESFRMAYMSEQASVTVDRDDPDVRRLTEAIAFFSARTHMAGLHNIRDSRLRLFQQFFPFLLSPIPSMGILQAEPTAQFQEKAALPKGMDFVAASAAGNTAMYRTIEDLTILPVKLEDARLILMPAKGFRLLISFKSMYQRRDEIGKLSLHLDYLNDYKTSLYLMDNLKEALKNAFITFEDLVDETTRGTPCTVSFGNDHQKDATEPLMHPMQESRFFFHFPAQDLFMHINVPEVRTSWDKFTICIDLSDKWPSELIINKDVFKPFAVPVENRKTASSEPVVFDGTKEKITIRHPEKDARYELQTIKGVYQVRNGTTSPLRPGILSGGEGSYEVEYNMDDDHKRHNYILLHYPTAFIDPVTITIEAEWIQPGFSDQLSQKVNFKPYSRHIPGINWQQTPKMTGHGPNRLNRQMDSLLSLLALRHKSKPDYNDIVIILETLGSVSQGPFKQIMALFKDVRVEEARIQKSSGSALKYIYHLIFLECEPSMSCMVKTFAGQVEKILDNWISQARVETRITFLNT